MRRRKLILALMALFAVVSLQIGVSAAFFKRRRPVVRPQTVTLAVTWQRQWTSADTLCFAWGGSTACFSAPEGKTSGVNLVSLPRPAGPVSTEVHGWEPGRLTTLTIEVAR
jgi:hypothetical protein